MQLLWPREVNRRPECHASVSRVAEAEGALFQTLDHHLKPGSLSIAPLLSTAKFAGVRPRRLEDIRIALGFPRVLT
jgi:hypothetical protein